MIAGLSRATAGKGLAQQFEIGDFVGLHEESVRKTTTAFASSLIPE